MIRLALLCVMFLSCAHTPTLEERCTPMLTEILSIQEVRGVLADEMSEHTRMYKGKKISKEKFGDLLDRWMRTETELRNKVTRLYNIAYQSGCL